MARQHRVLILAALVASFAAEPLAGRPAHLGTPQADRELRVMVYNIHAGYDAVGRDNLPRVGAVIREAGADLALLQEVDVGTDRSRRVDQPALLASLTGLHSAFGRTLHFENGEYGIAVLSRWPMTTRGVVPLPVSPVQQRAGGSHEPRGALHVSVATPFGPLHVINTHLDPSRDDASRRQEASTLRELRDRLAADGRLVLIGGDFNDRPGTAVLLQMTADGWRDAWAGCSTGSGYTYPASRPDRRIDFLLLPSRVRCRDASVLDTEASDHRPVLFRLAVDAGPAG